MGNHCRQSNLTTGLHTTKKWLYRLFCSRWLQRWMRIGHAAKGLLYGLIALLAVRAIVYDGQSAGGSDMVIATLGDRFLGSSILAFIAIGLMGYACWRFIQVVLNPGHPDKWTWHQGAQRCGYGISCLSYGGIGYTAGQIAIGLTVEFDDTVEDAVEILFEMAIGPWALLLVGLGVILVGTVYIYGAYSGGFISEFQYDLYALVEQWAVWMGKIGYTARGVSFILIGLYLMKAAYFVNDETAGGLGKVLDRLDDQPFGKVWLGAIAIGFIAYASYMLISAFYRQFPAVQSTSLSTQ